MARPKKLHEDTKTYNLTIPLFYLTDQKYLKQKLKMT